jgi:hypothetical protein
MAKRREDGDEYTSANGYRYRRVRGQWVAVHRLVAEEELGRQLRNNESAYFVDNDKSNLDPSNIGVRVKGGGKDRTRLAVVEDRIRELQAERAELLERLGGVDTPAEDKGVQAS